MKHLRPSATAQRFGLFALPVALALPLRFRSRSLVGDVNTSQLGPPRRLEGLSSGPNGTLMAVAKPPTSERWSHWHDWMGRMDYPKASPAELLCQVRDALLPLSYDKDSEKHGRLQSTYRSCAVVSSSGTLRKHRHGEAIDEADVVFRFNNAPTSGFEKLVGRKDDVRFVNDMFAGWMQKHMLYSWRIGQIMKENRTYVIIPVKPVEYFVELVHDKKYDHIELYMINRDELGKFSKVLREIYSHSWFRMEGSHFVPTSGAIGMLIALSMCDEVKAYGMAATPDDQKSCYHYYEPQVEANGGSHKTFLAEKDLWRRLAVNPLEELDEEAVAIIPGFSQAKCPA